MTTQATADQLPPLPEPLEIIWPTPHKQALGCGVEDRGIRDRYEAAEYGWQDGVDKAAECLPDGIYDATQMHAYALASLAASQAQVEKLTAELKDVRDDIVFVERWANHHGQKPHTTPQAALSCIQHYPPILAITRSYADGKVPETHDPYAEIVMLRAAGSMLANCAFNVAQSAGAVLSKRDAKSLKDAQVRWDAAITAITQGAKA